MNNKVLYIINGIIIASIIVLYVLFFTSSKKNNLITNNRNIFDTTNFSKAIYYINFDTILSKYDMYLDLQAELEKKAKESENELAQKERKFQTKVNEYQINIQKGLLLRSEAQEIEKQLALEQQDLLKLQEKMRLELAEQQAVINRKVLNSIMEYLEKVQPKYNYHFVLGTSFGGGVLYANKNLDITNEVVEGLNEEYRKIRKSERNK